MTSMAVHFVAGVPYLLKGSVDGRVQVWDLASGSMTTEEGTPDVMGPGGVVLGKTNIVNELLMVTHPWFLAATSVVPNTHAHMGNEVGCVQMINLETFPKGPRVPFIRGKTSHISASLFSHTHPVAKLVYVGDHSGTHFFVTGANDGILRYWKMVVGAAMEVEATGVDHVGHIREVTDVIHLPPSSTGGAPEHRMWSASADGTIIIWKLFQPEPLHIIDPSSDGHTSMVNCLVAFDGPHADSQVRRVVASGGADGMLKLWDENALCFASFQEGCPVRCLAVVKDRNGNTALVAGLEDGNIAIRATNAGAGANTYALLYRLPASPRGSPVLRVLDIRGKNEDGSDAVTGKFATFSFRDNEVQLFDTMNEYPLIAQP